MTKCKGEKLRRGREKQAEISYADDSSKLNQQEKTNSGESHRCLMCHKRLNKLNSIIRHLSICKVQRPCLNRVVAVKDEHANSDVFTNNTREELGEVELPLSELKNEEDKDALNEVNKNQHVNTSDKPREEITQITLSELNSEVSQVTLENDNGNLDGSSRIPDANTDNQDHSDFENLDGITKSLGGNTKDVTEEYSQSGFDVFGIIENLDANTESLDGKGENSKNPEENSENQIETEILDGNTRDVDTNIENPADNAITASGSATNSNEECSQGDYDLVVLKIKVEDVNDVEPVLNMP